jgi:hypothetical protein
LEKRIVLMVLVPLGKSVVGQGAEEDKETTLVNQPQMDVME